MKRQSATVIAIFVAGSIALLALFAYFGIPALFGLAGTISGIGNSSQKETIDKVILNAPNLNQEFEATRSGVIRVSGKADQNTRVELTRNTISLGTEESDKYGNFEFKDVALEKGKNEFLAKTLDKKGNESSTGEPYIVYYLTSGPKIELSNHDGDKISENPFSLTGMVDPVSATVSVNDRLAIVDSSGNFSYYMTLSDGDNKITVIATDEAGNETKQELTLKYEQ